MTETTPATTTARSRLGLYGIGLVLASLCLWLLWSRADLDRTAADDETPSRPASMVAPETRSEADADPEPQTDDGPNNTATAADPESETGTDREPEPHQRPLPSDGPAMISALDEAEAMVRRADLTNAQLDSWGRRQQSLYRHLSFRTDWVDDVLTGVEPSNRDAVRLNWEARQNLSALVGSEEPHDSLPAWRVAPPLPPQTLLGYYKQAEAETGIAWEFLAAINLVETRMGRIEGISTAGAMGPMQFLPTTWAECCEGDPTVPADAIAGAARYLTIRGGPDNMDRAIFGYNNSDYYVNAVTAYATVMMADERAYYGYHGWEIYFLSTAGLIRIPVGYEQAEPVPADDWVRDHPESLFTGET